MSLSLFPFLGNAAEKLAVGAKAPAVTCNDQDGKPVELAKAGAQGYLLVYFYPKASTPGCTKQGCSLRDAAADLKKKGVAVIGVSTDSVEKQKEFKDKNNFAYPLLADTDKKVIAAFGQSGGMMASREAYLIDRKGKVVYHDKGQTEKQAEMVLAFLNAKKS